MGACNPPVVLDRHKVCWGRGFFGLELPEAPPLDLLWGVSGEEGHAGCMACARAACAVLPLRDSRLLWSLSCAVLSLCDGRLPRTLSSRPSKRCRTRLRTPSIVGVGTVEVGRELKVCCLLVRELVRELGGSSMALAPMKSTCKCIGARERWWITRAHGLAQQHVKEMHHELRHAWQRGSEGVVAQGRSLDN